MTRIDRRPRPCDRWRLHFYMCDLEDNRRDVASLLNAPPGAKSWFPGHFGTLTRAEVVAKFGE